MIVDNGEFGEELGAERQPVFDRDVDTVIPMLKNEAGPGNASCGWYTMYIAFPDGRKKKTNGLGGGDDRTGG